ncbi:MAG TPA: hypothetical protein VN514_02195 [Ignavibacteria bacterium]|nr:hypothetical protein [Ignavibacteria bacterium]
MDTENKDNINKDLNDGSESAKPVRKRGRKPGTSKTPKVKTVPEIPVEKDMIPEFKQDEAENIPEEENVKIDSVSPAENSPEEVKPDEEVLQVEYDENTKKDKEPSETLETQGNESEDVNSEKTEEQQDAAPVNTEDTAITDAGEESVQPVTESNYQVSLIDENVLLVKVSTRQSVLVECSVKDKSAGKPSEETQSNKIFIHPRTDDLKQEVEVQVTIGSPEKPESVNAEIVPPETESDIEEIKKETTEIKDEPKPQTAKASNYQVTLTDENILRIKIPTKKSVTIESSVKDKSDDSESEETQSNRIFIHPKAGTVRREVEIFIKIGVGETAVYSQESKTVSAEKDVKRTAGVKLTPNPIVADLINKFREPKEEDTIINGNRTPEEILEDRLGKKNPWRLYHNLLQRNMIRGTVSANVLIIIAAIIIFSITPKTVKEDENGEQKRLIVMQDLPENLNQMNQNVDDPNRPPDPPTEDGTTGSDVTTPKITTPKLKAPRITVPKVNTSVDTNIASLNGELDSLRKKNISGNNGNSTGSDTGKINTSLMPDSLLKNLTENEVGLIGKFPPNWKQIDSRSININQKEFSGIILVDTTAKKKEEALNMSIQLDSKGDYWKQFQFKNVFAEDSLRTIYSIDPKIEAKLTYYRFYVASKLENVFIAAYVEPSVFEKYKPEIEQVVRTIIISKPQKK